MQSLWKRGCSDPAADLGARTGERSDVVDIEGREPRSDARLEFVVREKLPERKGRRRKPAGDADAGAGKLSDHFAERGVLSAHLLDGGHSQAVEWNDPCPVAHCSPNAPLAPAAARKTARKDAILPC